MTATGASTATVASVARSTVSTAPKSSLLLSSTFRPFYPRAHQQPFNPLPGYVDSQDNDCHVSPQLVDGVSNGQSHLSSWSHGNDPKFYDQQYYSSMGPEPYEVPWVSDGGTVWGDSATWQQWFDPTEYSYLEDDCVDTSVLFSDSRSYYAGSHSIPQGNTIGIAGNATSAPLPRDNTQLLSCHLNEFWKEDLKNCSTTEAAAKPKEVDRVVFPEQVESCLSAINQTLPLGLMESTEKYVRGSGFDLANEQRKDAVDTFVRSELDLNLSASQGSGTNPSKHQLKTNLVENLQALKGDNSVKMAFCELKSENQSVNAINTIHHVSPSLDTAECTGNSNFKSSTNSFAAKEAGNAQSKGKMFFDTDTKSSIDFHKTKSTSNAAVSKEFGQVNDFEGLHQDQKNMHPSQPDTAELFSNGPHVLVECIYNLSKVLLSSQSKGSKVTLDSSDCLLLEKTICLLSHCLVHCSTAGQNPDPQAHATERESNILNDSKKSFVESASSQIVPNQLLNLKQILNVTSNFQQEILQTLHRSAANCSEEEGNQSSDFATILEVLLKELQMLIVEIQKLQEVKYESFDNNNVSMRKYLWHGAEDALNIPKAEDQDIRGELASMKHELVHPKLSGTTFSEGPNTNVDTVNTIKNTENENSMISTCHGGMPLDFHGTLNDNIEDTGCRRLQEGLEGYLDVALPSNQSNSLKSFVKQGVEKRGKQASYVGGVGKPLGSRSLEHMFAPPSSLERDVAQRLSLLLSRGSLDLNKSCTESCVEGSSQLQMIQDITSSIGGEEVNVHNEYLAWSETSSSVTCQKEHLFGGTDNPHDLVHAECTYVGIDATDLVGISDEEDMEIICFKPGFVDSNSTCLTTGPEWDAVFVTAVDDQRPTKQDVG